MHQLDFIYHTGLAADSELLCCHAKPLVQPFSSVSEFIGAMELWICLHIFERSASFGDALLGHENTPLYHSSGITVYPYHTSYSYDSSLLHDTNIMLFRQLASSSQDESHSFVVYWSQGASQGASEEGQKLRAHLVHS